MMSIPSTSGPWSALTLALLVALLGLAGCGGSGSGNGRLDANASPESGVSAGRGGATVALNSLDGGSGGLSAQEVDRPTSGQDASRILQQATFGPTARSLAEVEASGPRKFVLRQMDLPVSQYSYTLPEEVQRARIHTTGSRDFCGDSGLDRGRCWRDYYSALPVQWEFFRHAATQPDQLRQRVAWAWSQIFVASARQVEGAYGLAEYQQMLRNHAFADFGTLLERVATSPYMGRFLTHADNAAQDPNENFARELLQLFSIGPCLLNDDGSLVEGRCIASYGNEMVRNYAYALTGWTYPAGGVDPWCDSGCRSRRWTNPVHYRGVMVAKPAQHDSQARPLLSGVTAPAGRTPAQALSAVIASLVAHPNAGPFIGRQMIQFLVTSNPRPAYVARVAKAFREGRFVDAHGAIGSGRVGDMRAVVAAVLLDAEARDPGLAADAHFGRLREPVQLITAAIRVTDGLTDGDHIAPEWGHAGQMNQPPFMAPSVFNFYSPDYPLAGTTMVAPQFGIESINATLARINYLNALYYWWSDRGTQPGDILAATGTRVDYGRWEALLQTVSDSGLLVDRLALLLIGQPLEAAERQPIIDAMGAWQPSATWLERQDPPSNWKRERVKTALYLLQASPRYQIQR